MISLIFYKVCYERRILTVRNKSLLLILQYFRYMSTFDYAISSECVSIANNYKKETLRIGTCSSIVL